MVNVIKVGRDARQEEEKYVFHPPPNWPNGNSFCLSVTRNKGEENLV
jgi:hypothetical protein